MRAYEFIIEQDTGSLVPGLEALPATTSLPQLKSQDPYEQYRFGLALASARAKKAGEVPFHDENEFGENMIVSAYTPEEEETLQLALKLYGKHNAQRTISSGGSRELPDTYTQSPIQSQPRIQRKK